MSPTAPKKKPKKKLTVWSVDTLSQKIPICYSWKVRLREALPYKFTIADVVNARWNNTVGIDQETFLVLRNIYAMVYDYSLPELSFKNSQEIQTRDNCDWVFGSDAVFLSIAWMLLENGYEI